MSPSVAEQHSERADTQASTAGWSMAAIRAGGVCKLCVNQQDSASSPQGNEGRIEGLVNLLAEFSLITPPPLITEDEK